MGDPVETCFSPGLLAPSVALGLLGGIFGARCHLAVRLKRDWLRGENRPAEMGVEAAVGVSKGKTGKMRPKQTVASVLQFDAITKNIQAKWHIVLSNLVL